MSQERVLVNFLKDWKKANLRYFIFRSKFEAMLFALCKDEETNTASMRFFLDVSYKLTKY